MYTDALETSANAAGTLQEQQDIYMESTAAHLQQLKTEAERTYDILFNQDTVNGFADALTGVLSIFNNLLDGLGGGASDFIYFGSIVTNIFKKQIASGINNAIENIERLKQNTAALNLMREVVNQGESTEGAQDRPQYVEDDLARAEELLGIQKYISNEEFNELNTLRQQIAEHEAIIQHLEDEEVIAGNITKEQAAADYKKASDAYREQVKSQQEILRLTKEINKQGRTKADKADDIAALKEQMALIDRELIGRTDINNLKNIENSLNKSGQLSQKEINQLEEIEQRTLISLNNTMQERLAISKAVVVTEKNSQAEIQETHDKLLATYNAKLDTDKRKGQITELVQGLSTLTSLLTSISGIVKTLNDEDLTAGEKIERITTVLLANLPMLIMNFNSLKSLIPNVAAATNTLAIAMGAEGITAASGFGASLMGIISIAGPYAIAIGLIVGAMYALVKAYNADSDAAAEAAKAAKEATKEFEETKKNADDLKRSVSDYSTATNSLKKLKAGTEEYSEALKDANDKALALIESLKLYGQYTYENGQIVINPEALEKAQMEANRASNVFAKNNYTAQMRKNNANLELQTTELRRQLGNVLATDANGQRLKGTSYSGIEGTQISNESITSIVTALNKLKEVSEADYVAAVSTDEGFENLVKELGETNPAIKAMTAQIVESRKSFKQLAESTDEITASNRNYLNQANLLDIKNNYGDELRNLARDSKTGIVNEGVLSQIAELVNNSRSQENIKRQKEERRKYYQNQKFNRLGETYTDSKA